VVRLFGPGISFSVMLADMLVVDKVSNLCVISMFQFARFFLQSLDMIVVLPVYMFQNGEPMCHGMPFRPMG
jgi:hypothetical protein